MFATTIVKGSGMKVSWNMRFVELVVVERAEPGDSTNDLWVLTASFQSGNTMNLSYSSMEEALEAYREIMAVAAV